MTAHAPSRETVVALAQEQNAAYPQYAGYWNGPEWELVRIERDVKTKLGLVFRKGDYTVACPDRDGDERFVTAYSFRSTYNTSIRAKHVRRV